MHFVGENNGDSAASRDASNMKVVFWVFIWKVGHNAVVSVEAGGKLFSGSSEYLTEAKMAGLFLLDRFC